ncbi:MAG: hypothetical protein WC916_02415 [Candidatus Woesearchaeota archaeon]
MAKKSAKEEYDVSGIIEIDDGKKKKEDYELGRDALDADTDDDELDFDGDIEFDDGGD